MSTDVTNVVETWSVTARESVIVPSSAAEAWGEISPFDTDKLPPFPTDVLPVALRDWVAAESCATQTPADLAGLLALAVCAAAIARKVEVAPRAGWREPVNLFAVVLLEPGNRKSAVFHDAILPLRELEAKMIDGARSGLARKKSERRQKELRLKKLEKAAAEKNDDAARREAGELAEQLAIEPEIVPPRLIVDDVTSEQLAVILGQQGGRIASMSPEGGVFDLMAGLYSKSGLPQFGMYLMGHSGDDLTIDRVDRPAVYVSRPALTCAYAIQPQVIAGLASNRAFRGRGLLARFLYARPESWIGRREITPLPVPDGTKEDYQGIVNQLASRNTCTLSLTDHALLAFTDWQSQIEGMLADGGQMESMRDWGAKLADETLRLAGVLHCVEQGAAPMIDQVIVESAIKIARYLIPHAEAVLNMMEAKEDSRTADARYLLRWIERHQKRTFTKSEAQHHGKRRFKTAADIQPVLDDLVRRCYIRPRPSSIAVGRPASPVYDVRPALFAAWRSGNSCN